MHVCRKHSYIMIIIIWSNIFPPGPISCIAAQLRLLDERQVEELVSTDYEGWFRDVTWTHHSAMGCWIHNGENKGGPTCTNHPQVDLCWSMLILHDRADTAKHLQNLANVSKHLTRRSLKSWIGGFPLCDVLRPGLSMSSSRKQKIR